MKTTAYFDKIRGRSDRIIIRDEWIQQVMERPEASVTQADGRIRIWGRVSELNQKYLRVICLTTERRFTMHFLIGGSAHENELFF